MDGSFKGKVLPLAPVEFYVTLQLFPNVNRKKVNEKENEENKDNPGTGRFVKWGTFDGKQFVRSRVAWKAPRCN